MLKFTGIQCYNASFESNTDPTVIDNEFSHYFAGNFVNSSDNVC